VLAALAAEVRDEVGPRAGVGTLTFIEWLGPDDTSREALWFAVP
jgi:hypothetical protein